MKIVVHNGIGRFTKWGTVIVGQAGRSKNDCCHFKLVLWLCCFWPNISPHTKLRPNHTENTEVQNFSYWSVLVGWSKNGCRHFKLCCFKSNINPIPNFFKIGRKTQKFKIWSVLVGRKWSQPLQTFGFHPTRPYTRHKSLLVGRKSKALQTGYIRTDRRTGKRSDRVAWEPLKINLIAESVRLIPQ